MKAVTNFRENTTSGDHFGVALPTGHARFAFHHGVVWIPNICEAIHFEGAGLGGGGAENPQPPRGSTVTQKDKGFL